jgi:hypothetical protein
MEGIMIGGELLLMGNSPDSFSLITDFRTWILGEALKDFFL